MLHPYIRPYTDEHAEYLKDESRTVGQCACIAFPRSHEEAQAIIVRNY